MGIEARMTLCNMTIEWGGRTCLVAPDETTFAWCRGRPAAPAGPEWDEALAWWRTLATDADAVFDQELEIDCSAIGPQITWGTDPAQTIGVTGRVPVPTARLAPAMDCDHHAGQVSARCPSAPLLFF